MIFIRHIHIPKCAGSSIAVGMKSIDIDDPGPTKPGIKVASVGHCTYRGYLRYFVPAKHYFAVIRNPWDRAVSWYEYSQQTGGVRTDKKKVKCFRDFLENREENMTSGHQFDDGQKRVIWNNYAAQTTWLTNDEDKIEPSIRLLKFENLQEEWSDMLDDLNIRSCDIPHKNSTVKRQHPYTVYYDDWCREFVSRVWSSDIENFGYVFGENL